MDTETVYIIFDKETDGHRNCLHKGQTDTKSVYIWDVGVNSDIRILLYRLNIGIASIDE